MGGGHAAHPVAPVASSTATPYRDGAYSYGWASTNSTYTNPKVPDDVVIPELVDTLEWVLDSPPNVHQFEEPPVDLIIPKIY